MQFPISNVQGVYINSLPRELRRMFKVFWYARFHGLVENLKSLGENTGWYLLFVIPTL